MKKPEIQVRKNNNQGFLGTYFALANPTLYRELPTYVRTYNASFVKNYNATKSIAQVQKKFPIV
jgi:hypothetical protein